jgi:tetratricopeptide (TPR) repeat protein
VIVLAAFLPVCDNAFVNLDDPTNFLENPSYRGLGWRQIVWAWTTWHLGVYQPLSWMLLEVQYVLWGLDPRGYHLTSLALHVLVVVALFALTVTLIGRCRGARRGTEAATIRAASCLAVGLFAVHPMRTEVVAWVSCQPYLVCAFLAVLAVLFYLRAHDALPQVHRGWLAGSFLLFTAAVLAKAVALALPLVLLVLDGYPLRRFGPGGWRGREARRLYREKVPFVALSALILVLGVLARAHGVPPLHQQNPEARLAQACYGVWFYIGKTVAPLRISACYPLPARMRLTEARFFFSTLAVLAVTAGLVALRRRWPAVLAAWLSYLLILAPSSGAFLLSPSIAADRYSYLPLMPLFLLTAAGLCAVARTTRSARPVAAGVHAIGWLIVLSLVPRARDQCRTWHDSDALWSHALRVSTEPNPFASYSLGIALARNPAQLAKAEALIAEAVRWDPDDYKAQNGLATILARRGRLDAALAHIREALRLNPEDSYAWVNLGNILAMKGESRGALAAYEKALRIEPNNPHAHNDLGMFLLLSGRSREAEAQFLQALRINPGMVEARRALENLRRRENRKASPPANRPPGGGVGAKSRFLGFLLDFVVGLSLNGPKQLRCGSLVCGNHVGSLYVERLSYPPSGFSHPQPELMGCTSDLDDDPTQ